MCIVFFSEYKNPESKINVICNNNRCNNYEFEISYNNRKTCPNCSNLYNQFNKNKILNKLYEINQQNNDEKYKLNFNDNFFFIKSHSNEKIDLKCNCNHKFSISSAELNRNRKNILCPKCGLQKEINHIKNYINEIDNKKYEVKEIKYSENEMYLKNTTFIVECKIHKESKEFIFDNSNITKKFFCEKCNKKDKSSKSLNNQKIERVKLIENKMSEIKEKNKNIIFNFQYYIEDNEKKIGKDNIIQYFCKEHNILKEIKINNFIKSKNFNCEECKNIINLNDYKNQNKELLKNKELLTENLNKSNINKLVFKCNKCKTLFDGNIDIKCPSCAKTKTTLFTFLNKLNFKDKNNDYDYENVKYINSKKKNRNKM